MARSVARGALALRNMKNVFECFLIAVLDCLGQGMEEGLRAVRAGRTLEGGEDRRHSLDGKMPRAVWTTGGGVRESPFLGRACARLRGAGRARHGRRYPRRDARVPGLACLLAQLSRVREEGERRRQGRV